MLKYYITFDVCDNIDPKIKYMEFKAPDPIRSKILMSFQNT